MLSCLEYCEIRFTEIYEKHTIFYKQNYISRYDYIEVQKMKIQYDHYRALWFISG